MLLTTFSGERKSFFLFFFVSTKSPLLSRQGIEMTVCYIKLQFWPPTGGRPATVHSSATTKAPWKHSSKAKIIRTNTEKHSLIQNSLSWQILSSLVSMYLGSLLLHNRNPPHVHGNSPAGRDIKQPHGWVIRFLAQTRTHSSAFPCRGFVWQRLVEQSDLKSQRALFPVDVIFWQ